MLRAFIATGSAQNATFAEETLFIQHSLEVIYKLSDRWFITTVSFATLDFLALGTLIALLLVYKKTRRQHREFRQLREKSLKYDNEYGTHRRLGQK
jgi:uncharacterized membrane protein affecting hemolysin expression